MLNAREVTIHIVAHNLVKAHPYRSVKALGHIVSYKAQHTATRPRPT